MDDFTRKMVLGVAVPIALGAGAAIVSRSAASVSTRDGSIASSSGASSAAKSAVAAALIGVAWVIGQYGFFGPWQIPAISGDALLRFQAPIAFVIALIGLEIMFFWMRGAGVGGWRAAKVAAAVGLASAGVVLWRKMSGPDAWLTGTTALALASSAAWGALLAWPIARMTDDGHRIAGASVLVGIAAAIAAGLLGTASQALAELTAPLAIACAGALGVMFCMRRATVGMTTIAAVCGGLAGPLIAGVLFSSTPTWLAWLLAAAPLAGYVAGRLLGERGGPALGAAVRIGVPALVAAAGIAPGIIALIRFVMGEPDASDHGY